MATLPEPAPIQIGGHLDGLFEQFIGIASETAAEAPPPPCNPAAMARAIYAERRSRERLFPSNLFGEPAWDMLLDLFAAQSEGKDISVTSACIAAQVPPSTGLRTIQQLEAAHLVERQPDPRDQRRIFIRLRPETFERMEQYLISQTGRRPAGGGARR